MEGGMETGGNERGEDGRAGGGGEGGMTRAQRRTKVVVVVAVGSGRQFKDNSAEVGTTEEGGRREGGEIAPRA